MQKNILKNENIKSFNVLLIDNEGDPSGLISKNDAIVEAKNQNMDLIQVGFDKQRNLPVCKIIDYGKMMFDQNKKNKKQKNQSKPIKEMSINRNIADYDLNIKLNKIRKFLQSNHQVKFSIQIKGREMPYKEEAVQKLRKCVDQLSDVSKYDKLHVSGRSAYTILSPNSV